MLASAPPAVIAFMIDCRARIVQRSNVSYRLLTVESLGMMSSLLETTKLLDERLRKSRREKRMKRMQDKVALVTGGSRSIVARFVALGAKARSRYR
jgi:heme exporter protein D